MRWLLALLLLLPAAAAGAADVANSGPERLVLAVRAIRTGNLELARSTLTSLLNDPATTDRQLRLAARVYLGEVLLAEGDRQAAWDAFRAILADAPEHRLDPYEHPPEIVDFFETVRAATMAIGPDAPPPEPQVPDPVPPELAPLPVGAYVPFGLHQFKQGRVLAGSLLAAGEAAFLAGTFATGIPLYVSHETGDPDEFADMKRARAFNWSLGGAFAVLWAVGVGEANLQWRAAYRERRADWERQHASSALTIEPGGVRWDLRF